MFHHCSLVAEKVPSSGEVWGNMASQGPWLAMEISGAGFMWQMGPGDIDASLRGKRETDQKVASRAKWTPCEQPSSLQAVTEISAQTLCQYLDRTYLWYLAIKPYCPQFQEGTLPSLAEMAAARNGCGGITARSCAIHRGAGDDGSLKRKCNCLKPIHCQERSLMTNAFVLSQLWFLQAQKLRKCVYFWIDAKMVLIVCAW